MKTEERLKGAGAGGRGLLSARGGGPERFPPGMPPLLKGGTGSGKVRQGDKTNVDIRLPIGLARIAKMFVPQRT